MSGGWSRSDAVLDAIYRAIERFEHGERRVAVTASITGVRPERVTRRSNGDRILTPRRTTLARYLTDAALSAIREYDAVSSEEVK